MPSVTERAFWREIAELRDPPPWHTRFEKMVRFIRPSDRVIDFGCGNQYLKELLHPDCAYQPVDCVPSAESGVFVCDYNEECRFPDFDATVLFFGGFFEYIVDIDGFMESFTLRYPGAFCIFSYAWFPAENRAQNHWVNYIGDKEEVLRFFGKYMVGVQHVDDWSDHTSQMICTGALAGRKSGGRNLRSMFSWVR